MSKIGHVLLCLLGILFFSPQLSAQFYKDRKVYLNQDGTQYIKFSLLNQVWLRHSQLNPGSLINGYARSSVSDIGIRRMRMQVMAQLTERAFLYIHLGENNFNFLSDRKVGFFVHDAVGEYEVVKKKLTLGAGLTGWLGLSRFTAPSTGTLLGLEPPLFEQSTIDVNDQFLRKLALYAKGKLGKMDYRFAVAQPMAVQKAAGYNSALGKYASFAPDPARMQWSGYLQYQFLDQESNLLPYATGTYLGRKRVFNVGGGLLYQKDATWRQGKVYADTVRSDIRILALDAYYDVPLTGKRSFSSYITCMHSDFGKGYLRNQSPMNPSNGTMDGTLVNGAGTGFPAYGTGNILYVQVGYKLRDSIIGATTFMPYAAVQHAKYDRLNQSMNYIDCGINWLLKQHVSKLTFAWQNRPVYRIEPGSGMGDLHGRKSNFVIQYQLMLN